MPKQPKIASRAQSARAAIFGCRRKSSFLSKFKGPTGAIKIVKKRASRVVRIIKKFGGSRSGSGPGGAGRVRPREGRGRAKGVRASAGGLGPAREGGRGVRGGSEGLREGPGGLREGPGGLGRGPGGGLGGWEGSKRAG